MFFKSNKIRNGLIIATFVGGLPFSVSASSASTEQYTSFECNDEEVATYLSTEGLVDRVEMSKVTIQNYEDAFATYKQKKKEKEGNDDCWAILSDGFDFTKYAEQLNQLIDMISLPEIDPLSVLYEQAVQKIQEELNKTLCERIPEAAEGFYEDQKALFEQEFEERKNKFIDGSLLKYADSDNFDAWMNKQLGETLKDEEGILTWRNGVNAEIEISDSSRDWENTLDRLFGNDD